MWDNYTFNLIGIISCEGLDLRDEEAEFFWADSLDKSSKTLHSGYSHISFSIFQQSSKDLNQGNISDFLSECFSQLVSFKIIIAFKNYTAGKFFAKVSLIFQDLSSVAPIIIGSVWILFSSLLRSLAICFKLVRQRTLTESLKL